MLFLSDRKDKNRNKDFKGNNKGNNYKNNKPKKPEQNVRLSLPKVISLDL